MANQWLSVLLALITMTSGSLARFSVDGMERSSAVTAATIQPRTGAPGYSWLRIYFYPSPLSPPDRSAAAQGRVDAIGAKWSAVLQLTLDSASTVWQVDLSLPGHTCTIAESDRAAKSALRKFEFDGARVRLVGTGSHVCDMKFIGVPNQTYAWDLDVDAPVARVSAAR